MNLIEFSTSFWRFLSNSMDFTKCSQQSKNAIIVVEESGRKFRIKNPKAATVRTITIDGCLIDDKRERCDYVFELGDPCHCAIYLELKGSDIEKAVSQLTETLGYLSARHTCKKICHIVASRVPKAGPKVQNLKVEMARKHRVLLHVGTTEVSIQLGVAPYC